MESTTAESFVAQREGEFWLNAVIGAVVAVVLSFVPFSPLLGGGVAGYLRNGTRTAGAKVGAASGLIAALPVIGVVTVVFGGLGLGVLVEGSAAGTFVLWTIMLVALLVTTLILGGLGAIGGYLGVVLRERSDGQHRDDESRPRADDRDVDLEVPL